MKKTATTRELVTKGADPELSAPEAKAIAKEAYIYGFPMVMGYKTIYNYAIDKENTDYKGPFNKLSLRSVVSPAIEGWQTNLRMKIHV